MTFPHQSEPPRRLKLVSCEIFYREMCAAVARSRNCVDVEFLPKGLHDMPSRDMLKRLQEAVDAVEPGKYDAILMGYALCNNGLAGLAARHTQIVVPRAHDCITLFLGSKERYLEYFNTHPGVYFKTSGWIERGCSCGEITELSVQRRTGMDSKLEDLVAKYGEENGRYIYDTLCADLTPHYQQFTFISMGMETDARHEEQVRREAAGRGWKFECVRGDGSLIQRLLDGPPWDERAFLLIPTGSRLTGRYDEQIIACEKCP